MRRTILIALGCALGAAVVLELVLPAAHHGELPWWHTTTGFFGAYGVVGCAVLVSFAKLLGKLGLQKPEPPPEAEAEAPLDPAEMGRGTEAPR